MFSTITGAGSPRGAATPPFGSGANTPPLGGPQMQPQPMNSAMGSMQMSSAMPSVDLVPRLSMPRGSPLGVPSTLIPDNASPLGQAYGPGGYATMAPPIDRSTDLTNTGASLNPPGSSMGPMPPRTVFPGGLTPPGSMPPGAVPPSTMLPPGTVPPGAVPPSTMIPPGSMPPGTIPPGAVPPATRVPPGAAASMPPMMPMGSMPMGSMPPQSMSVPPLTMPAGGQGPPLGPPGSTLPPTSGAAGPFQTVGPGPPQSAGSLGGFGKDLTVIITRLLDMPDQKTLFGKSKGFRVRAFDDEDRELGATRELPPDRGAEADSIPVPAEEGKLKIRTHSPLLFLQVEHVGLAGIMGNEIIGRCQIHRMDPRSSQIWPYALSDPDGSPASCGIELKVEERHGLPGGSQALPQSTAFSTTASKAAPPMPPGSMRRPETTLGDGPHSMTGMQDMNHGVSALLEFDKATDLPYPSDETAEQLMIVVLDEEKNKELRRVGPFPAKDQRGGFSRLVMTDFKGARVFARAPLHFGGNAEEGAMFVKVGICYLRGASDMELLGATDPIKVSWRPSEKKYYEIRQGNTRKVLGGVYLTHRLMTEGEMSGASGSAANLGAQSRRPKPSIGAPLEAHMRVSGRTCNFPAGSPEEAFEQAAINCEAQNRALLQRCKIADPASPKDEMHVRTVHGYREWDSLDSLFSSMGPNPLAHSEDLGPSVARSYCETTNMLKELVPKLGPSASANDEQLNLRLINMMYGEDPWKVTQTLRPVICKDPNEIADSKDMQWCPDPPVYAPLRNMSEHDKETMRLACFDPRQNAKLMFADANPNYRIDQDVWGVLSDYKTARSLIVPKPESAHRRVKDDCIMA